MNLRQINSNHIIRMSMQRGFTLLEAMIALVVLSVGLLGLAALQARSMQYNHDALTRSQASMLASDIMDRMRSRAYDITDGAKAVSTLSAYTGTAAASCPAGGNLTQAEELRCWLDMVQNPTNGLPGGSNAIGTVTQTAGTATTTDPTDDIYQVSIQWVDRNSNTTPQAKITQNFAFQP